MAEKKRRRWWIAILVAAALVTAVATLSEASSNRPLRYYSEDGFTAMTFYTNSSGDQNRSLWGINTDDPQCELDINGTICINRTGVYVYGINLTPGSSGAPTGATYLTLSLDAGLSAERVLTAGNGITFTDTGANGVLRINLTGLQACSSGNVSMWDGSQWNCVNLTTSGSSNTFGYGLNVSGNHITIANLTACNPSTEYSVWDGTEWSCDNDGGGTDTNNYTSNISFNVSGSNYQLNLERVGMSNLTANFTIPATGSGSGNITGSLVAGEGVYSFNATHLTTNKILYVQPNNWTNAQETVDRCVTNQGCLVIFPSGNYNVNSSLRVNYSYVTLMGEGNEVRLNVLANSNLDKIFDVYDASYGTIKGFFINGNKATQTGGNGYGIVINRSARYRLENLYITDTVNDSITLVGNASSSSSHAAQLTNIRILNSGDDGISLLAFAYDTELMNIWIGSSTTDGVKTTSGSQFFTNFHSWGNGNDGINLRSEANKLTNCYLETNTGDGLDAFNNDRNIITNCYIWSNTLKGLQLQEADYSIAANNLIKNNGDSGILASNSQYSSFTGNVIDNNDEGIDATSSNHTTIVGNSFIFNSQAYTSTGSINNTIGLNTEFSNNNPSINGGTTNSIISSGNLNSTLNNPLFINNSQVCTSANGLCNSTVSSSEGNVSNLNVSVNDVPRMINSTTLVTGVIKDNGTDVNITTSVNRAVLHLYSTFAGRSTLLELIRPGSGGLFFTGAGGTPVTSQIGSVGSSGTPTTVFNIGTATHVNFSAGDLAIGNGASLSTPSIFAAYNRTGVGIGNSAPNFTLDIRGTAAINGSQICTADGTNCPSASSGNITGTNGTAGLPAIWSSATNIVAQLISNFMIGDKAVNSSQLNTSNAGSSGQYLMRNSTGGMDWNTITTGGSSLTSFNITNLTGQFNASLTFDNGTTYYAMGSLPASGSGSGNLTGNITSGYIPYATNNTHFENSRLTQNATANTVAGDWFVNNYVQDRTNQNYMNILETEFCPGNLVNNAPYDGFTGSSISSGIVGSLQANQSHPCILGMGDSTTANGGVMIRTGADAFRLNGTENATFIWKQQATQDQFIRTIMGFFDTSNMAEPTDGCMFYMQMNNHSGQNNQLSGRCVSNSVSRNTSNNYTFTNNTWYITKIEINNIATNVTFKVYNESGSLLWNNSVGTNIPVAVGRETGFGVITNQNNTDASITYMHMDYMGLLIKRQLRSIVYNG